MANIVVQVIIIVVLKIKKRTREHVIENRFSLTYFGNALRRRVMVFDALKIKVNKSGHVVQVRGVRCTEGDARSEVRGARGGLAREKKILWPLAHAARLERRIRHRPPRPTAR